MTWSTGRGDTGVGGTGWGTGEGNGGVGSSGWGVGGPRAGRSRDARPWGVLMGAGIFELDDECPIWGAGAVMSVCGIVEGVGVDSGAELDPEVGVCELDGDELDVADRRDGSEVGGVAMLPSLLPSVFKARASHTV